MKLIEVKGLAAASGSILLTPNERRVAEDRPDCYWWTMAGGGWGEAENVREAAGLRGTSDLGLRLGLIEVRRRVGAALGGAEFGVRADAAWAELRTAEGGESIDNLTTAVHQQRVGAEVSRPVRLGDLALQTFGEAHLRRDGSAGQVGRGLEVAGGLRAQSGIVRIDAQGRVLALHSADGYRERGAAVTLTVGGQGGEGLSLSPHWGDAAAGTSALWQEEVYRRYLPGAAEEQWTVDARGATRCGFAAARCSPGSAATTSHTPRTPPPDRGSHQRARQRPRDRPISR